MHCPERTLLNSSAANELSQNWDASRLRWGHANGNF